MGTASGSELVSWLVGGWEWARLGQAHTRGRFGLLELVSSRASGLFALLARDWRLPATEQSLLAPGRSLQDK